MKTLKGHNFDKSDEISNSEKSENDPKMPLLPIPPSAKIPDKPKKGIDLYLDIPENEEDKFSMFLNWCKSEGIVMSKLEYPAYFQNGLVGVRCKEDI